MEVLRSPTDVGELVDSALASLGPRGRGGVSVSIDAAVPLSRPTRSCSSGSWPTWSTMPLLHGAGTAGPRRGRIGGRPGRRPGRRPRTGHPSGRPGPDLPALPASRRHRQRHRRGTGPGRVPGVRRGGGRRAGRGGHPGRRVHHGPAAPGARRPHPDHHRRRPRRPMSAGPTAWRRRRRTGRPDPDGRRPAPTPRRTTPGPPATAAAVGRPSRRTAAGTRVLVVDDDPSLLRALTISLGARGYEVAAARTGEEGLDRVAHWHPDVVLLDLGLPGIDGVEVIRGIRGWSEVPIIVLSARHQSMSKVEALDLGADDYVTKPFGMDELLARLRAALRRAPAPSRTPGSRPRASPSTSTPSGWCGTGRGAPDPEGVGHRRGAGAEPRAAWSPSASCSTTSGAPSTRRRRSTCGS